MRIRYRRFHFLLDLFGALGVSLTIYFYTRGHSVRETNQELHALWANFATEIVAIWLGIRIIEYVIRKYENEDRARIRIVRSMRFLMRFLRNGIEYPRRADCEQLDTEFSWIQKMFKQYGKHFRRDEIRAVESFYSGIEEANSKLRSLLQLVKTQDNTAGKVVEEKREELWLLVDELEKKRLTAEENILAETEEEWL